MNIARGLFRTWVVLSLVWFIVAVALAYEGIRQPYIAKELVYYSVADHDWHFENALNAYYMDDALKGLELKVQTPFGLDVYAPLSWSHEITATQLGDVLKDLKSERSREISSKRLDAIGALLLVGFGVPFAVFTFGYGVLWAARGFKR